MSRALAPRSYPVARFASVVVAAFASSAAPRADLLVGQVVDSLGVGVPGVDIDVENLGGGGDPTIFNDGTNGNGDFAVTVPAGFYRIIFNPPPPPSTSHLKLEVDDVVIAGTTNMGVVALPPGVALSGRAVDLLGFPVAGVDIDVVDEVTGDKLDLSGDLTDAFGQFAVAVPANEIELRFDTSTAPATLAGVAMNLTLSGDTDVGDVTLEPGLLITGVVTNAGGSPLQGIDLDVEDAATGADQYVPQDNTGSSGDFSLVVPQGVWDVMVCPQVATQLVADVTKDVAVSSDVDLGTIALQSGVVLSGTITDGLGQPVKGTDVDVDAVGTGLSVPLCSDNSNAAGAYAVVVPTGNYDVTFSPSFSTPYGSQLSASVAVTGATIVDAVVPDCPFGSDYGVGLAGAGGFVPVLGTAGGAPRVGNPNWHYTVQQGLGGTGGLVLVGLGPSALPVFGGTLLVDLFLPNEFLFAFLGGAGAGNGTGVVPLPIPIGPAFAGLSVYAQVLLSDPFTPQGISLSNGRSVTFCE